MSELSDSVVIQRVLAGDGDAYAILVRRYRTRFLRYAVHMLGNQEDAEEALQDALVRAWQALGRCRNPERFDGWLFRILANRCRTRGARRQRYEATFVQDEDILLTAPSDRLREPSEESGEPSWSTAVDRAIAVLEPDQREAFLLKYVEELSYDEMATLTGVGTSALKMRVKRAADRLRELLGERANAGQ